MDAASRISKSKIKETAAAFVVGIGRLAGSTDEVQAACDPPVFDVRFHKTSGEGWTADSYVGMDIQFKGESGKKYEVVWHGLKRLFIWDWRRGPRYVFTREDVSDYWYPGGFEETLTYDNFYWDHTIPWDWWYGYGCSIYEGKTVNGKWVRGNSVASVHFYSYQEAALIYLYGLPFELNQYYCTIDYEPGLSSLSKHGYTEGCWEWVGPNDPVWPKYNGWRYHGDHGSPRFDYESSCSYEFDPSPSFGWRCSWDTSSSGTSD